MINIIVWIVVLSIIASFAGLPIWRLGSWLWANLRMQSWPLKKAIPWLFGTGILTVLGLFCSGVISLLPPLKGDKTSNQSQPPPPDLLKKLQVNKDAFKVVKYLDTISVELDPGETKTVSGIMPLPLVRSDWKLHRSMEFAKTSKFMKFSFPKSRINSSWQACNADHPYYIFPLDCYMLLHNEHAEDKGGHAVTVEIKIENLIDKTSYNYLFTQTGENPITDKKNGVVWGQLPQGGYWQVLIMPQVAVGARRQIVSPDRLSKKDKKGFPLVYGLVLDQSDKVLKAFDWEDATLGQVVRLSSEDFHISCQLILIAREPMHFCVVYCERKQ